MKIHVEVWLAAASLHEKGREVMTTRELQDEVKRVFGDERSGVVTHITARVSASSPKAHGFVYNYLTRVGPGTYRLCRVGDPVHASRLGRPLWPDQVDVDEQFWPLWRKWVAWQQGGGSADDEVAVAGESVAPGAAEVGQSAFQGSAEDDEPGEVEEEELEEESADAAHYLYSSYREAMLEHLLLGELMRVAWRNDWRKPLGVYKPQVDSAGVDVVLVRDGVTRPVQLKTSKIGGRARAVNVHRSLWERPGSCVIWTWFDPETLELKEFLWLGEPGQPLPPLEELKEARHTKGNAQGYKAPRPALRVVPKRWFKRLTSVEDLLTTLFEAYCCPSG